MSGLRMTLHDAAEGDAITLSWGPDGEERHALIDLGRTGTYRAMRPMLAATGRFELFVVTHVDADHIEGAMPLVREATPPFDVGEVWFNAYHHLLTAKTRAFQTYEAFSVGQGEKLSEGIRRFGWASRWNAGFAGGPVSTASPEAEEDISLDGGLTLRLLSPSDRELAALEPEWRRLIERLGLAPGQPDRQDRPIPGRETFGRLDVEALARERFGPDDAVPNGTSIAFLASHGDARILLTGDCHPGRLEASLRAFGASEENRLKLGCLKLSHHGSKANTSPGLLGIIDCTRFAISTDGTRHDHPDPQTIARILMADPGRPKELIFNKRQPHATVWGR